jgi:HK97 family phage major capsid protein
MIPSSLVVSRGFVLRKVRGAFDACRSFGSSTGARVTHPSLLATVGAFVMVLLPVLALMAVAAAALLWHPAIATAGVLKAMPALLTAKSLREQRATLATEANDILVRSKETGLSAEDQTKFDAIHADIERLGKQAESIEKHERTMADLAKPIPTIAGKPDSIVTGDEAVEVRQQRDAAFSAYLRGGVENLTPEQRTLLRPENRTAQTVTTTGGGYLIPQGFSSKLEESMLAYGGMESVSEVFSTDTGNTLPYPTFDDTAQTGAILAINTQASEQAITYGVINFAAYKFSSKYVTVPVELMQDSAFDVESHVASVLGTRLGRVHNTYQTTGTGSSQPQGIVTGASSALTAAGTSTVTADEILSLIHAVDPAYRSPALGAGFIFNDGTLLKLRQLKDGEGRPLWQPGIAAGAPDTIFGFPYLINQDMAAMTTGLKPVLFGARKKFMIRKVKDVTILRLNEIKADYHQVVFLGFTRMDSHVLDSGTDPVKYITMA